MGETAWPSRGRWGGGGEESTSPRGCVSFGLLGWGVPWKVTGQFAWGQRWDRRSWWRGPSCWGQLLPPGTQRAPACAQTRLWVFLWARPLGLGM